MGSSEPARLIADQIIASSTNVLALVVAARALGPDEFGLYSLVAVGYGIVVGLAHSIVFEPHLISVRRTGADNLYKAAKSTLGIAVVAVLPSAAFAALSDRPNPMLIGIACLPGLLWFELVRHHHFALRRARVAIKLDSAWFGLVSAGAILLESSGTSDPAAFVAVWLGSGSVIGLAAAALFVRAADSPRTSASPALSFATDYVLMILGINAAFVTAGLFGGARGVGALNATNALFGPVATLTAGVRPYVVGRVAESAAGQDSRSVSAKVSILLAVVAIGSGTVALLAPDAFGEALFGDTWRHVRTLLLPLTFAAAGRALAASPHFALRARHDTGRLLFVRALDTTLTVSSTVIGGYLAGVSGVAWGWATANAIAAVAWWHASWQPERRS